MRIFLAGASGVIGRRLVPLLVTTGHEVIGATRSPRKTDAIAELGAEPVVCDVLDGDQLRQAVAGARPEAVVQHLTDLPPDLGPRNIKGAYAGNDRLRDEGTRNLLAAAGAAGARRYVAQTVCFMYAPEGGPIKDESAPLIASAPPPFDRTLRISKEMEQGILEAPGLESTVLRCGMWYGPDTTFAGDGFTAREVRARRFPIVGRGTGVWSFVHVDDVASATLAAIEGDAFGVYNIVDDEPAAMSEWVPAYAELIGAKRPLRVPRWLARLFVPSFIVHMTTAMRGASAAKAKRELGWTPRYPSWRGRLATTDGGP